MITWTDVVNIAPELATVPVNTQNAVLADVVLLLSPKAWGVRLDMASKWLAAHIATIIMRSANGPAGAVVGESVGGISRQYAAFSPMGTDPIYSTTTFGREYQRLLRTLSARVGTVA